MQDPDAILEALDESQRAAARAVDGPVLIMAGAGSGKTRTITHRIAYASLIGAQRPDRALAVTFTAKAAGEMRSRLADLGVAGVAVDTFHAAALRQLRYFWPLAVGGQAPGLLPAKAGLIAEAAASLGLPRDRLLVRDLAAEAEWAKVSRVSPEDYPAAAAAAARVPPGGLSAEEVGRALRAYGDLLAERGLMDFEDVLVLTTALLAERPDLADQVRQRYRWITVDEYQDVSPIQQALLEIWLGDSDQLCVVGDPGQTIYTFAGASADYLLNFRKWFPHAAVVPLARTYRCSPQIVAAANSLLAAGRSAGRRQLRLESREPDGPPVRTVECGDDLQEARAIAAQVAVWRGRGVPLREIAVLVRINAATAVVEEALTDEGIRYTVRGGERFFARPEIKEALLRLRGAARAESVPGSLEQQVAAVLSSMGFQPSAPPAGRGAQRDRWESLAALVALAGDMRPGAGLAEFVAELDRRSALDAEPSTEAVTVATLHASKGLEWDCVWIAGLHEGSLPISHADTRERIEEERRLCYVGLTRARRELVLSWAPSRNGDRGRPRAPSRFLRDLAGAAQVGESPRAAAGGRRRPADKPRGTRLGRCRVCGKGLPTPQERAVQRCRNCPEEIDIALLERLKQWRTEQARAAGAPAYTVFTDLTLRAIAELRPVSPEQLLGIVGVGPAKLERYGRDVLRLVGQA